MKRIVYKCWVFDTHWFRGCSLPHPRLSHSAHRILFIHRWRCCWRPHRESPQRERWNKREQICVICIIKCDTLLRPSTSGFPSICLGTALKQGKQGLSQASSHLSLHQLYEKFALALLSRSHRICFTVFFSEKDRRVKIRLSMFKLIRVTNEIFFLVRRPRIILIV